MRLLLTLLLTAAALLHQSFEAGSVSAPPRRGLALLEGPDPATEVQCSSRQGSSERPSATKHGTEEPLLEEASSRVEVEHEDLEKAHGCGGSRGLAPWHRGGPLPPGFLPASLCYLRTNGPANANGARG